MDGEANDGWPVTAAHVLVVDPPFVVTYIPCEFPLVPVPPTTAYTTGVAEPEEPLEDTGRTDTTPFEIVDPNSSGIDVVTAKPVI